MSGGHHIICHFRVKMQLPWVLRNANCDVTDRETCLLWESIIVPQAGLAVDGLSIGSTGDVS